MNKKLKYTKQKDLNFIYNILKVYFDYVRKDNLKLMIKERRIIFDNNIFIGFRKYKKRVKFKNIHAPKGSYIIYWIINIKRSNKKNWINTIKKFCQNKTIFYKTKNINEIEELLKIGFEILYKSKNNKSILLKREDYYL